MYTSLLLLSGSSVGHTLPESGERNRGGEEAIDNTEYQYHHSSCSTDELKLEEGEYVIVVARERIYWKAR